MKQLWINICTELLLAPASFYVQDKRKIVRTFTHTFEYKKQKTPQLTLDDLGYKKQKLSALNRLYVHQESLDSAKKLWTHLVERGKYSSACFTTYNHFIKPGGKSPTERVNTRSPCLQSVALTLLKDKTTAIDVFYRSTEVFKKFPADLIFLEQLIFNNFMFVNAPVRQWTFHIANVAVYPMYFATLLPHLEHPYTLLDKIKKQDPDYYKSIKKHMLHYLRDESIIKNYRQAQQVKEQLYSLTSKGERLKLQRWLEDD